VAIGEVLLILGNLLFLANFYLTSCRILRVSSPAWFNPPATMEAPTS